MPKVKINTRRTVSKKRSNSIPKTKLEKLYSSAFRVNLDSSRLNEGSLEQPSSLKYVESNTTYGVFETLVK
jgi:hypothetical protein